MSQAPSKYTFLGMPAIIRSTPMRSLLDLVQRVARINAGILITGESGVGKELVARAVHHYSEDPSRPWVDVSCAVLPEHLVESELFGHEKGAFSSADSAKPGLFELADGGTLFLDEIGELDLRMQVKLLRVLDGVPFYRVGGTKKIDVNVRIVAASNREIGRMAQEGTFRADLYHRLSQIHLEVPSLRKRRSDILPLAEHFLAMQNPNAAMQGDVETALLEHTWPGNVRELRNVIVKAATMCLDGKITIEDLPAMTESGASAADLSSLASAVNGSGQRADWSLEGMERRLIFQVLEKTDGHQQRAAELLGISRRTLSRKLKSYGTEVTP